MDIHVYETKEKNERLKGLLMKREQHHDPLQRGVRRNYRRPSRNKRNRRYAMGLMVLFVLFVVVGTALALRLHSYHSARQEYEAYRVAAASPTEETVTLPPTPAPTETQAAVPVTPKPTPKPFVSTQVKALARENSDTVGWIDIPGTDVQYPVVQRSDNEYYLTRTFKKKRGASGAIFMDCFNAATLTDFNTVIYGHHMKDGSMFAILRQYEKQSFADKHLTIEITLPDRKLIYQVFSAYTAKDASIDFRGQECRTEEERSTFIKQIRKRAVIDSSLSVSRDERLLTLVTCTSGTNDWYYVIHAKLLEEITTEEP